LQYEAVLQSASHEAYDPQEESETQGQEIPDNLRGTTMVAIVFDTETTGFISSIDAPLNTQPKIIELFALKIDEQNFEIIDELELLIDPREDLQEEIIRVTGLNDVDLKGKGEFAIHANAISDFWLGSNSSVGHNITFDCDMLEVEFKRLGRVNRFPWSPKRICTVEASEHYFGRRLKLIDLHTYLFSEGFEQAHRARNDVMATYRCVKELHRRGDLIFS
jgi:DNA polymerase III epsilon subunit-like protein